MNWQADLVQAVLFTDAGVAPHPDALLLWSKLFEEGPDSFQRGAASPGGVSNAAGSRDGRYFTITSQLGRIDLFCSAEPAEEEISNRISDFQPAAEILTANAIKLCHGQSVNRVAIVLSLAAAPGDVSVIQAISAECGVRFPDEARDPVYQFNLRSSVSGVPINRLVTWGVNRQQFIRFGNGEAPLSVSGDEVVTWKIDVNTVRGSEFRQEYVPQIFRDVLNATLHIVADGREALA